MNKLKLIFFISLVTSSMPLYSTSIDLTFDEVNPSVIMPLLSKQSFMEDMARHTETNSLFALSRTFYAPMIEPFNLLTPEIQNDLIQIIFQPTNDMTARYCLFKTILFSTRSQELYNQIVFDEDISLISLIPPQTPPFLIHQKLSKSLFLATLGTYSPNVSVNERSQEFLKQAFDHFNDHQGFPLISVYILLSNMPNIDFYAKNFLEKASSLPDAYKMTTQLSSISYLLLSNNPENQNFAAAQTREILEQTSDPTKKLLFASLLSLHAPSREEAIAQIQTFLSQDWGKIDILIRTLPSDCVDIIINYMLRLVEEKKITNSQFERIYERLIDVKDTKLKEKLIIFAMNEILSPDASFHNKWIFLRQFKNFPDDAQHQIIEYLFSSLDNQSITLSNFSYIYKDIIKTQNTILKRRLHTFAIDHIRDSFTPWEVKKDFITQISTFPIHLQRQIIDYALSCIQNNSITIDEFSSIFSSLLTYENTDTARNFANYGIEILSRNHVNHDIKNNLFEGFANLPKTAHFDDFHEMIPRLLKQSLQDPTFISSSFKQRYERIKTFEKFASTPNIKNFAQLLSENIDFEQAYLSLDRRTKFGDVHTLSMIRDASKIATILLEKEREFGTTVFSDKDLLEKISFLITSLEKERESNPQVTTDMISNAQDILQEMISDQQHQGTCFRSDGNLWTKTSQKIVTLNLTGNQITLGDCLHLVFRALERNQDHPEYKTLVCSFINALGSKEAILKCGDGALGGILRSLDILFIKELYGEDRPFSTEDQNLLDAQLPQLKKVVISFVDGITGTPEGVDSEFFEKLMANETFGFFLNHLKMQNWGLISSGVLSAERSLYSVYQEDVNEILIKDFNLLLIDPAVRILFSEFFGGFIHNSSLRIEKINDFLTNIEYIPLR